VDSEPVPRRLRGWALLGLGIAIELGGVAVLVWQEQDVPTINSGITLPTWGAMLVGVALVAGGYARVLHSTAARPAFVLGAAGAAAGTLLLAAALAWELADGLVASGDLDLEVYAAVALFFLGVAVLTTAIRALGRSGSDTEADATRTSSGAALSRGVAYGRSAAIVSAGVAFLAVSAAAAGWLNTQATDVNSLYQFVALELAGGGAWLLLSGASNLLVLVPAPQFAGARRVEMVAGVVFLVAGATTWWRTAPLVDALGEILLGGFVLAGAGLLLVSGSKGRS
jgi:hypothetical protein